MIKLAVLDEHMLVINIVNDEVVAVLVVNTIYDGFDGRIAFHENACPTC